MYFSIKQDIIKVTEYFVILLENAVHNGDNLLEVHLHGPVSRMMLVRGQLMVSVILIVVVLVVLLHVGDGFEQLQPVQPVVVVRVVLPEVLHQQPRVVHVVNVILHVVLLHLLLDMPAFIEPPISLLNTILNRSGLKPQESRTFSAVQKLKM